MSQNLGTQLHKENVIPDVLPSSTSLSHGLVVKWPSVTLDEPGQELDREATQSTPTLFVQPTPDEKRKDYVLIMSDPDLMARNDTNFGQVRHWFATDISVNADGQLSIPEDTTSPYIGPAPLPNYITPRPHRYVFILCRPSSSGTAFSIQKDDFTALQKNFTAAFEGPQESQDLKDRWGFDAKRLIAEKSLEPVAATFMLVGGTLKSAIANAAMTAQAGVNKIMGQ